MLREEAVTNVLGALFKYNILISGSFFMQSFYWDGIVRDAEWYNSKPYIIGCNFGPYINEIVPIVYSEKMSNVLNDMEYIGKIIYLKNINLSSDFCLDDYLYQLDNLKLDDLIYLSEKNFETLDLIFK